MGMYWMLRLVLIFLFLALPLEVVKAQDTGVLQRVCDQVLSRAAALFGVRPEAPQRRMSEPRLQETEIVGGSSALFPLHPSLQLDRQGLLDDDEQALQGFDPKLVNHLIAQEALPELVGIFSSLDVTLTMKPVDFAYIASQPVKWEALIELTRLNTHRHFGTGLGAATQASLLAELERIFHGALKYQVPTPDNMGRIQAGIRAVIERNRRAHWTRIYQRILEADADIALQRDLIRERERLLEGPSNPAPRQLGQD